jgi:hypothetical protein
LVEWVSVDHVFFPGYNVSDVERSAALVPW